MRGILLIVNLIFLSISKIDYNGKSLILEDNKNVNKIIIKLFIGKDTQSTKGIEQKFQYNSSISNLVISDKFKCDDTTDCKKSDDGKSIQTQVSINNDIVSSDYVKSNLEIIENSKIDSSINGYFDFNNIINILLNNSDKKYYLINYIFKDTDKKNDDLILKELKISDNEISNNLNNNSVIFLETRGLKEYFKRDKFKVYNKFIFDEGVGFKVIFKKSGDGDKFYAHISGLIKDKKYSLIKGYLELEFEGIDVNINYFKRYDLSNYCKDDVEDGKECNTPNYKLEQGDENMFQIGTIFTEEYNYYSDNKGIYILLKQLPENTTTKSVIIVLVSLGLSIITCFVLLKVIKAKPIMGEEDEDKLSDPLNV